MTKKMIIFLTLLMAKISLSSQTQKLDAKIKQKNNEIIIKISKNTKDSNVEKEEIYVIKKGDTLSELALKYKKSVKKIAKDNSIKNIDLIIIGNILILK